MSGSQYKVNVCTQLSILLILLILENRKGIRRKNCLTNKIIWLKKKEKKLGFKTLVNNGRCM